MSVMAQLKRAIKRATKKVIAGCVARLKSCAQVGTTCGLCALNSLVQNCEITEKMLNKRSFQVGGLTRSLYKSTKVTMECNTLV